MEVDKYFDQRKEVGRHELKCMLTSMALFLEKMLNGEMVEDERIFDIEREMDRIIENFMKD